MLSYILGLMPR